MRNINNLLLQFVEANLITLAHYALYMRRSRKTLLSITDVANGDCRKLLLSLVFYKSVADCGRDNICQRAKFLLHVVKAVSIR